VCLFIADRCTTVNSEYRVTLSRQLGDLIYDYCNVEPRHTRHCLQLAQRVYLSTSSHAQAMVCMVRLSDVETALEYAEQQACDDTQLAQVPRLLTYAILLVVLPQLLIFTQTATVVAVMNTNLEKNAVQCKINGTFSNALLTLFGCLLSSLDLGLEGHWPWP